MEVENGKLCLHESVLDQIFSPDAIQNFPVVILSLAGAKRSGKSFLLNLLTRYFKFLSVGKVSFLFDHKV